MMWYIILLGFVSCVLNAVGDFGTNNQASFAWGCASVYSLILLKNYQYEEVKD